ncbi:MAG TPA: trigger factor [Chitinophagales bacterium]|nr:trigger factor [Chitinophagales bacterium]
MTITEEKTDSLVKKVRVNLAKEDYEPAVKKQIKTLAKQVSIKGFRPGMVPLDMVKKMYGNSVLVEELNKVLNDEVYKYINDNKLEIIASPIPAKDQKLDIDINSLKDVDFSYEVALAPDIDLSYLDNGNFTKYKIQAEEKMLDEEIDRIRKRFATYEYPEVVGETDVLTFSVEELNADGTPKEGGQNTVTTLTPDLLKDDAKAKVLPLKKQESFEYNVFELMDRDREAIAKNVLNMNDLSKLDEVGTQFKLTLNNITRSVPAVINEEFFVKVYGENGPKTEEEMRANIKSDLEAYFDGQTDSFLVNDIYKVILEKSDFPLPDEFLKRWIEMTNEKPVTAEEIEQDYPGFSKSLRWSLVQRKVVTEQNIEVTNEEVAARVRANMIQQLYGYGLKNIGEDWVEQFVQKQLADKKVVSQTREQLLEDKVLTYIKSKVNLTEKPTTLDEFKALVDQTNAA